MELYGNNRNVVENKNVIINKKKHELNLKLLL